MNGVPAGPPSPQLSDVSTMSGDRETLMMNPGDSVTPSIRDTGQGLLASVTDLSTGRTGFMVASAKNGFMNTNIADCTGTPFSFHPEYNTARQQNQVPWAALEGGVLMQQEFGHFEPATRSPTPSPSTGRSETGRASATHTRRRPVPAVTREPPGPARRTSPGSAAP
jgi:hypothetical protein